ncbi:MAG: tryptophan synthase subunit beta like protein, partial [Candidatus Thiodiazotropha sp.]
SKKLLSETNAGMIRIVEDLIALLIQKNLIMFTDLPNAAQQKILMRNQIRSVFQSGDPLLVDDDELL